MRAFARVLSSTRSESADSYIANDVRTILVCHVCLLRFIALRRAKCQRHLMAVVCAVRCKLACISNAQRAAIETRRVPAKGCFYGFCLQDTCRMVIRQRTHAHQPTSIWLIRKRAYGSLPCERMAQVPMSHTIPTPHGFVLFVRFVVKIKTPPPHGKSRRFRIIFCCLTRYL